jgi:Spy/CpxP family protein refolding chaperone
MKNPSSAPRLVAALLLAFAVGFGFIGGVLADRLILAPRESVAAPGPAARPGGGAPPAGRAPREHDRGRYLDFLDRELALTPEQRTRLEGILQVQQERMDEVMQESRPRMREIARETRDSVQQVLTPEQRTRFEELRRQRDHERGAGEPRRPASGLRG